MKMLSSLLALLCSVCSASAQYAFSELRLDSTYSIIVNYFSETDTFSYAHYTAYKYDDTGREIEQHSHDSRIRTAYHGDTVFNFYERREPNNTWIFQSRAQEITTGHTRTRVLEKYDGRAWTNAFRQTTIMDDEGRDTSWLYEEWATMGWGSGKLSKHTFDECGQEVRNDMYKVRFDGLQLTEQYRSEYNANDLLVQKIHLRRSGGRPEEIYEEHWKYGESNRVDTLNSYRYIDGILQDKYMDTYVYFQTDSTIKYGFKWRQDEWQLTRKEVIIPGDRLHFTVLDSNVYTNIYYLCEDNSTCKPVTRKSYLYKKLAPGSTYFRQEEWNINDESKGWQLDRLTENWYTIKPKTAKPGE